MTNLDYICIKHAQEISKIQSSNLENNLRKALGVLQEDGVYAMFLWLEDKDKDKETRKKLIYLLNDDKIKKYFLDTGFSEEFSDFCGELQEVAKDIDKLFFMKKILERTLTYALYHAKVGKNGEAGENNV